WAAWGWGGQLLGLGWASGAVAAAPSSPASLFICDAGGTFGKKPVAKEERYFREKEQEQLSDLWKHHEEETHHHQKETEQLQKEIEPHKHKIKQLKDD
ncbi:LOW QUALITY PROTEIN: ATPase inhibitor, mitochondrial-like, partial [Pseudopipra pipra]|uniref:LOW QUALITY PROTEIN: ATPase inhibitor, mitochondrial-like n=1 Tax=Pseudopipra pipra TaxID=415032 RepID=UPI00313A1144